MKSCLRNVVALSILWFCFAGLLPAAGPNFSFTSGTPPNAAVNTGYPTFTFSAVDTGCASTTYSFASADLPSFLSLASTGQLAAVGSGATTVGAYTFHVTATDSCTGTSNTGVIAPYTIQVSSPGEYYNGIGSGGGIQALNGGTSASCNNCSGFSAAFDLELDSTGANYLITSQFAMPASANGVVYSLPLAGGNATQLANPSLIPNNTVLGPNAGASEIFISAVRRFGWGRYRSGRRKQCPLVSAARRRPGPSGW